MEERGKQKRGRNTGRREKEKKNTEVGKTERKDRSKGKDERGEEERGKQKWEERGNREEGQKQGQRGKGRGRKGENREVGAEWKLRDVIGKQSRSYEVSGGRRRAARDPLSRGDKDIRESIFHLGQACPTTRVHVGPRHV